MGEFVMAEWPDELARMEAEQSGDPAAYLAGFRACMAWASREPPAGLSDADTALWTAGWDDACDAPLGSAPDAAELMRACPVFRGPHMMGNK